MSIGNLGLTETQCIRHSRLMNTPMNDWPPDLAEYVLSKMRLSEADEDTIILAIADWLKEHDMPCL